MRILLIEDEKDLRSLITSLLEKAGYAADQAGDGEQGSFLARTNEYDLIITDYIMPKLDGFSMIKEIREDGVRCPILMLSVRQSLKDKIGILDAGADDYLPKPFAGEELLARVRALLRRPTAIKPTIARFGDISVDPASFKATRGKNTLYLSNKEFSLLYFLIRNAGRLIKREDILEHVWGGDIDTFSNTLETHIYRLRHKVEKKGERLIANIPGRGYRLELSKNC
ncbi:MAG: response regulator transcription factor [Bacillota bacterium]